MRFGTPSLPAGWWTVLLLAACGDPSAASPSMGTADGAVHDGAAHDGAAHDGPAGDAGTISHGLQLTLGDVGPAGIGISSFTDVPGGRFTGAALGGWGALARTIGPSGETVDGVAFPAGTVVLQGANLTSEVIVDAGWLVLRGCKGSLLLNQPVGDGGGGAALYSELSAFNAAGVKDGRQAARTTCHRCYFPHSGLENVYSNNVTVTESWIAVDPGQPGEHVDGIQTWGGQSVLNFSRNHLQWNGAANATQSGLIAVYSDGSQGGVDGYDQLTIENNYIVIGAGNGIGLHAPMAVATTNTTVTGNRWAWPPGYTDPDYTPAVYRATGAADYKAGGNGWSNNRWSDGPYADQFLLPDNTTRQTDY